MLLERKYEKYFPVDLWVKGMENGLGKVAQVPYCKHVPRYNSFGNWVVQQINIFAISQLGYYFFPLTCMKTALHHDYAGLKHVILTISGPDMINLTPGGRLNKKDGLTRYGDSHVKDKTS